MDLATPIAKLESYEGSVTVIRAGLALSLQPAFPLVSGDIPV